MTTIVEQRLEFKFAQDWNCSKFDEWVFYRTQFLRDFASVCSECQGHLVCQKCLKKSNDGTAGVDILAIGPQQTCWLIEIKDYRLRPIANLEFLADAVAKKVKDTLAALVIARTKASDSKEKRLATLAIKCSDYRVVLHLEQPPTLSVLHPSTTRQANLQQKLAQLLGCVDRQAAVVSMSTSHRFGWSVQDLGLDE